MQKSYIRVTWRYYYHHHQFYHDITFSVFGTPSRCKGLWVSSLGNRFTNQHKFII